MMMQTSNSDAPSKTEAPRPRVQSVARALALLMEVASSSEGLTAKELSDRLGLSRQTTYHLLHTLRETGFLIKGSENRHELGLAVGTLAEAFNRQLSPSAELLSIAREVAEETGEAAYISGWLLGDVVVLANVPGRHSVRVRDLSVGTMGDAYARASGKTLLAFSPPAIADRYLLLHPRQQVGEATIVDHEGLEVEFSRIRHQGFALDIEGYSAGICCISVPLGRDAATYVVSISCPKDRFLSNKDDYVRVMLRIAKKSAGWFIPPRTQVTPTPS